MTRLITLANGDQVHEATVRTVMLQLEKLLETEPIAFYELAMACRNPGHVVFGQCGSRLMERNLIEAQRFDGTVSIHTDVRSVVLNAAEGDGGEMHLVSPLPERPGGAS